MRVSFVLNTYALGSGRVIAAAREVFGERVARYANCSQDLTIECPADMLVRFMIARNERGATNGFKNLRVRQLSKPKCSGREVFA